MAENVKMVPLEVEGGGKTEWPVSEREHAILMEMAEVVFGEKPSEISFVVRMPPFDQCDGKDGERIVAELQKRLLHFRPEDRLTYFNTLKKLFCMECGGILQANVCHYCKAKENA
jgi:hypothetical protein